MGVWSYPFENNKKARIFCDKISRPWIAKVKKDTDGHFLWSADYLSFSQKGCLYGDDSLWDYLAEIAAKKKKNFDIRPYVKECLAYHMWYYLHQINTKRNLKLILLINKKLKLRFDEDAINLFKNKLVQDLKTSKLSAIDILDVKVQDPRLGWTRNNMPRETPPKYKNKRLYSIKIESRNVKKIKKEFFKNFKFVKSVRYKFNKKYSLIFFTDKVSKDSNNNTNLFHKHAYNMICKKDGSNKFWNIELKKNVVCIYFGASGSKGRIFKKIFSTSSEAKKFFDNKIREKISKGYLEK